MRIQLTGKRAALVASISLALLATSALASDKHGHGSTDSSASAQTPMQMGESAGDMMGGSMMDGGMMSMMKNMHTMMHGDAGGRMMGADMMDGGMMSGDMMSMMKNMHPMMHGGTGGQMMGGGMMDGDNLSYDSNGDGTTSVEELRDGLLSELTDYDADSNGTLEIGEFEKLHAARIRSQMVDRFQALDEDGDGQVTKEEMTAPADNMQKRMDRQLKSKSMPGMKGGAMQPSEDDKG